jgi:hypothetical protein
MKEKGSTKSPPHSDAISFPEIRFSFRLSPRARMDQGVIVQYFHIKGMKLCNILRNLVETLGNSVISYPIVTKGYHEPKCTRFPKLTLIFPDEPQVNEINETILTALCAKPLR